MPSGTADSGELGVATGVLGGAGVRGRLARVEDRAGSAVVERERLARDIGSNLVVAGPRSIAHRDGSTLRSRRTAWAGLIVATSTVMGIWIGETRSRFVSLGPTYGALAVSYIVVMWTTTRIGRRTGSPTRSLRAGIVVPVALIAAMFGAVRSSGEWSALDHVPFERYSGYARVVTDSSRVGRGRQVVIEIERRRFEMWVFGSKGNLVADLQPGDVVMVRGSRRRIEDRFERRLQISHVVGRFDPDVVRSSGDEGGRGSALLRAANRVRSLLRRGADRLSEERSALFAGLVFGDDTAQSPQVKHRFRSSGLAHLTAVSGQNVAYLLTVLGPLLVRLHRPTRVSVTIVILVWFAVLTRLEPSVIRAVTMAGISIVMATFGRPVSSMLALSATVSLATIIDPFLVWSIGWWLSVAGCVGLVVLSPLLCATMTRLPTRSARWVIPTLAAQSSVLFVSLPVFGWPSAWAVPCNLLAAPVAGVVMMLGIPMAVVASLVHPPLATMVMQPLGVAVAWVDGVARIGDRLDLPSGVDIFVSIVMALFVGIGAIAGAKSTLLERTRSEAGLPTSPVRILSNDGLLVQGQRSGTRQ